MSGVNQEAFTSHAQPPAPMGSGSAVAMQQSPSLERGEESLIPGYMLSEQQRTAALTPSGGMQAILGLTPDQEALRLQRFELELQAERESRKFWFYMLTSGGSIITALIVGLTAIFQFSPNNRANSYAAVAESMGRPEIKIDCGFRLAGECEAGPMADRALNTFEQSHPPPPHGLRDSGAVPAPSQRPLQPQRYPERLGTAVAVAADPRQNQDYQRAFKMIHQWSQQGYGSKVVAGHYYWLEETQRNPNSAEHSRAKSEPNSTSYKLAFEDYYQMRP